MLFIWAFDLPPQGGVHSPFSQPISILPLLFRRSDTPHSGGNVVLTSEQKLKKIKHCVNLKPLRVEVAAPRLNILKAILNTLYLFFMKEFKPGLSLKSQ